MHFCHKLPSYLVGNENMSLQTAGRAPFVPSDVRGMKVCWSTLACRLPAVMPGDHLGITRCKPLALGSRTLCNGRGTHARPLHKNQWIYGFIVYMTNFGESWAHTTSSNQLVIEPILNPQNCSLAPSLGSKSEAKTTAGSQWPSVHHMQSSHSGTVLHWLQPRRKGEVLVKSGGHQQGEKPAFQKLEN